MKIKQTIAAAAVFAGVGVGAVIGGITASDITSDVTIGHEAAGTHLVHTAE